VAERGMVLGNGEHTSGRGSDDEASTSRSITLNNSKPASVRQKDLMRKAAMLDNGKQISTRRRAAAPEVGAEAPPSRSMHESILAC